MGIFKKLSNMFKVSGGTARPVYWLKVRCDRCGEVIQNRVDLNNELSVEYGEEEAETTYLCRKVLIGEGRCFQPIEVILKFDHKRQLIDRQISGGQFVDTNE